MNPRCSYVLCIDCAWARVCERAIQERDQRFLQELDALNSEADMARKTKQGLDEMIRAGDPIQVIEAAAAAAAAGGEAVQVVGLQPADPPPPTAPAELGYEGEFMILQPAQLKPWPGLNPRTDFKPEPMAELVESIREHGVRQSLAVHRDEASGEFLIVNGERRWRAASAVGAALPAIVKRYTWEEALAVVVIENLQRDDLSWIETARGFQRYIQETGCSTRTAAERLLGSKAKQSTIANALRVLELPPEILDLVEHGGLQPSFARDVLVPFKALRDDLRAAFYAAVAKELQVSGMDRNSRYNVAEIARRMSRPVRRMDAGYNERAPSFAPSLHAEQCTCVARDHEGAPAGASGGLNIGFCSSNSSIRCFDVKWWDAAQAEAQRAASEAEAAAVKLAVSPTAAIRVMDAAAFSKAYTWKDSERIRAGEDLDPTRLQGCRFVYVTPTNGIGEARYECLDPAKVRGAKSAFSRIANQAERERRNEVMGRFIADLDRTPLEGWMLNLLMGGGIDRHFVADTANFLGIEVPAWSTEKDLAKLPESDSMRLAKLVCLRHREGDRLNGYGTIASAVRQELREKYRPAMEALLSSIAAAAEPPAEGDSARNQGVKKGKGVGGRKLKPTHAEIAASAAA